MPLRRKSFLIFIILFIFSFFSILQAQIIMPKIFCDNMVLQRDINIPVWGKANHGTEITIELGSNKIKTIADENGKWIVKIPALKVGGPYELSVYEGDNQQPAKLFKNILIGDVWFASGQSNMELHVENADDAETEIQNANYQNIRFFNVTHDKKLKPQDDILGGTWNLCDSTNVKSISAVAYYFAKNLHNDLNIPIGIIQSTWGGTYVESWTSREQLLSLDITHDKVLANDSVTTKHFAKDSLDLIPYWDIVYNPQNNSDKTFNKNNFDDSDWSEIEMPKTFKDMNLPFYEGIVWLRKSIVIPENMNEKDLTIYLGLPEVNYSLYFNEKEICKAVWNANLTHNYTIPASLVKSGTNTLSVRMTFLWGAGGFNPPAEKMYITDGNTKISIAGNWRYKMDLEPAIPKLKNYHRYPSYLFNAMVNPIIPYGIKGFIWYQGEENVDQPSDYKTLFPMLINDWRTRWEQSYLPFLFLQLPNYLERLSEPSESNWAELREAQSMALSLPNTGMAVTIDIGNANNIHPTNKKEVGKRLALSAEKLVYNKPVQASGPLFKSYEINGDKIIIQFNETGSGLAIQNDSRLKGFAIAGKDKQFFWAKAIIDGNNVIVSCDKVENPIAVRYAWADNPECNLINKEGFLAIPFRTDSWKLDNK